jgi:hypothetical protein
MTTTSSVLLAITKLQTSAPVPSPTRAPTPDCPVVTSELTTALGVEDIAAQYQQAFMDAAARWSEIIVGDLPDIEVGQDSGHQG